MSKLYHPIDCGIYDHFEAAIVQRRAVELIYLDESDAQRTSRGLLLDLRTREKEEFVQLTDGSWLRLDRVLSLDGLTIRAGCKI